MVGNYNIGLALFFFAFIVILLFISTEYEFISSSRDDEESLKSAISDSVKSAVNEAIKNIRIGDIVKDSVEESFAKHPFPKDRNIDNSKKDWAMEVTAHQKKITSQQGQDGSLDWIFQNIGTTNKRYVEFGFNTVDISGGSGPNIYQLYKKGWKGLLLDGANENPAINLQKLWIKRETIVEELIKRGVEKGTDYISVDFDSADCFVAYEIACNLMPRVMTVEYNSNHPLESTIANVGEGYVHRGDRLYGCAMGAHFLVAQSCGYEVVDVVPDLDIIYVRKDLLKNTRVPPLETWRKFATLPAHSSGRLEEMSKFLCDFRIWIETKSYEKCMGEPALKLIKQYNIQL